ncbi:MAG: hypothetical protein V4611_04235 [Patescibacteria group bacterium]
MITSTKNAKPTNQKVYFIRVGEKEYKKIVELAQSQDRSINNMANLLLKSALVSQQGAEATE